MTDPTPTSTDDAEGGVEDEPTRRPPGYGKVPRATGARAVAGRVALALVLVGALVGLFLTARAAVTGDDTTAGKLPEYVDRLIPAPGADVLRQAPVGIDVAEGHDAYLVINGTRVRTADDGVIRELGTGLIQFQPGPDTPIEELSSGSNCVQAFVWDRTEGEQTASPVYWCFDAT